MASDHTTAASGAASYFAHLLAEFQKLKFRPDEKNFRAFEGLLTVCAQDAALAAPAASEAASQPEALRLADALQNAPLWESQAPLIAGFRADDDATLEEAAAELRRLHALTTAAPAAQEAEPLYWVRIRSDGGHEGPIPHAAMEEVRKRSGAWAPLYAHPPRPQADAGAVAVPEGWRLVPVEPDPAMEWAFRRADATYRDATGRRQAMDPHREFAARYAAMLAAAPQAPAAAVAPAEDDDEEVWRRLALQFDGHRMRAIGLLKLIDHTLKGGPAFATEKIQGDIARFLSEPPLSGEEVLAERIARAAAPTQEAEDAARWRYALKSLRYADFKDGTYVNVIDWSDDQAEQEITREIDAARARQEGAHHER